MVKEILRLVLLNSNLFSKVAYYVLQKHDNEPLEQGG